MKICTERGVSFYEAKNIKKILTYLETHGQTIMPSPPFLYNKEEITNKKKDLTIDRRRESANSTSQNRKLHNTALQGEQNSSYTFNLGKNYDYNHFKWRLSSPRNRFTILTKILLKILYQKLIFLPGKYPSHRRRFRIVSQFHQFFCKKDIRHKESKTI